MIFLFFFTSLIISVNSFNGDLLYNSNIQSILDDFDDVKINLKCKADTLLFLTSLSNPNALWAQQMADSSGKLQSGLIRGNINALGNFDECLNSTYKNAALKINIQGKYCIASVPIVALDGGSTLRLNPEDMDIQSPQLPGARVNNVRPQNGTMKLFYNLGFCLPSSCKAKDFENFVSGVVEKYLKINDSMVRVKEGNCHTEPTYPWTTGDWVALGVFCFFILVAILSTLYDIWFTLYLKADQKSKNLLLSSFSLYSNSSKLTKITPVGRLSCLNGVRVLSMFWVILGHRYFTTFVGVVDNYSDYFDWGKTYASTLIQGGTVSVDSFFLMSGLLLSYLVLSKYEKDKSFNIVMFYVHRILRLTPAFAAMILLTATLMKHFGNGPFWQNFMLQINLCTKNWWLGLLYLQNYVRQGEACLGHSWYLAVDMQLYIISPLFLIPLIWKPKLGALWTSFWSIISVVLVLILSIVQNWKEGAERGTYYTSTHARAAPWFIGLLAGYFMVRYKKAKIHPIILIVGWICALTVMGAVIFGYHSFVTDTTPSKIEHVSYITLSRPSWALALLWIIVTCYYGYGGPINWLLSLDIFQILGRLSYSMYLIHLPMQYALISAQKSPIHFTQLDILHSAAGDIFFAIVAAYFWSLLFESPIINIEKVLFGGGKAKSSPDDKHMNGKPNNGIDNPMAVEILRREKI